MFLTTGESAVGVARQDNKTLSITLAAPMITDARPALLTHPVPTADSESQLPSALAAEPGEVRVSGGSADGKSD